MIYCNGNKLCGFMWNCKRYVKTDEAIRSGDVFFTEGPIKQQQCDFYDPIKTSNFFQEENNE